MSSSTANPANPADSPFTPLLYLPPTTTSTHPTKCIHTAHDLPTFLISLAYRDISLWILQLNHALIPQQYSQGQPPTVFKLTDYREDAQCPGSIVRVRGVLRRLEGWLEEVPVDGGSHRFGNPAFRRWGGFDRGRVRGMLVEVLGVEEGTGTGRTEGERGEEAEKGGEAVSVVDELMEYLVGGLGSQQRLDYGTGHELSFLAFLGGLWKIGFFKDGESGGPIERAIVLGILEPYLILMRKIILTYRLEPAGSHGVWGLDDHFFLSYIFGSAQLARPLRTPASPTPQEGSLPTAPPPTIVTTPTKTSPLAPENMYFSAITFIHDVKKGPFGEHSPLLYDISGITAGWAKINKGMIKMYNAEVLSKFPVVQHFPFGTLFSWTPDPAATTPPSSAHLSNQPMAAPAMATLHSNAPTISNGFLATGMPPGGSTGVPWATLAARTPGSAWTEVTRKPGGTPAAGIPYTRIPPSTRSSHADPFAGTKEPWAK